MKKEQNYRVAIVGPENIISGFRALGVEAFPANDREDAVSSLKNIVKAGADTRPYAVIIVIEDVLEGLLLNELKKAVPGVLPAVVAVPGVTGSKGAGEARLKLLAEKAIGSQILQ